MVVIISVGCYILKASIGPFNSAIFYILGVVSKNDAFPLLSRHLQVAARRQLLQVPLRPGVVQTVGTSLPPAQAAQHQERPGLRPTLPAGRLRSGLEERAFESVHQEEVEARRRADGQPEAEREGPAGVGQRQGRGSQGTKEDRRRTFERL